MSRTTVFGSPNYTALKRMSKSERLALARQQKRANAQQLRREAMREANQLAATKTVVVHVPQTVRGREERKYVDGYMDSTALQAIDANDETWSNAGCVLSPQQQTATYGCLPVPRQGDDYGDRDGRKIIIKKIVIRGKIQWPALDSITASAQVGPIVRLLVVKDTKANGAGITVSNVIGPGIGSDGQATLLADAGIMALSKPEGWGRYQIMKDKMYTRPLAPLVHDGTDGAMMGLETPFKFTLNLNTEVNFSASTGAIGSIVDNAFHLCGASGAVGTAVSVSYVARTTFVG